MKPLLTREQCAVLLGVSISTIQRMEKTGELEADQISRRCVRISPDSPAFAAKSAGGASDLPPPIPTIPSAPTITPAGTPGPPVVMNTGSPGTKEAD